MTNARQVLEIRDSPCVNCHAAPCGCIVAIVDERGQDRAPLRRYRFPDGTLLRLSPTAGARAVAAGAELVEAPDA